ncbi:MAG: hypothetical protein ACI8TP_000985 [Acidimicrobiales bacterium]|jgi:hypothetical protein
MTEVPDPITNPETPWEFLDEDQQGAETALSAEEAAVHIFDPLADQIVSLLDEDATVVVHYTSDEHPEIIDRTVPLVDHETTAEIDDLLIRQHYLPGQND